MAEVDPSDGLIHLPLPLDGLPTPQQNQLRLFALFLRGIGYAFGARSPTLLFRLLGGVPAILIGVLSTSLVTTFLAMTPIITGAYASLSRPGTAAKPKRRKKASRKTEDSDDDEDEDEDEIQALPMEKLGPADAIILPLFAGITLTGLYALIKWLEDPALLSKILNWYFAVHGSFATAKVLTDAASICHDFVFPSAYVRGGQLFTVSPKTHQYRSEDGSVVKESPLPGVLSANVLPGFVARALWAWRDFIQRKINYRFYVHNLLTASLKVGPIGITSAILAVSLSLYSNLIYTPWQLNNLFGFAFVHLNLQMLSPGTSTTASLVLAALFFYDIYFVFFTPIMVTVATQLDIPAKMFIPRPGGMGIIGLGDLVIPGMVIAWALRFDLSLHYLRLVKAGQKEDSQHQHFTRSHSPDDTSKSNAQNETPNVKAKYLPATGYWGTRFWTWSWSKRVSILGTKFAKPYFKATLVGYFVGTLATTVVMTFTKHAQPALLYLVPGVLGALWITAWKRGEVGIMYNYVENDDEALLPGRVDGAENKDKSGQDSKGGQGFKSGLLSMLWEDQPKKSNESDADADKEKDGATDADKSTKKISEDAKEGVAPSWAKGQILHFSARLMQTREPELVAQEDKVLFRTS